MSVILFCGQSTYPRNDSATANRYRALAEMTGDLGYEVVFVNRHPVLSAPTNSLAEPQMRHIDISGLKRSNSWLKRQIIRIAAPFREAVRILLLGKREDVIAVNVYTQFAFELLYYRVLAALCGATCIAHVVERRSSFSDRSILFKLNDWLFEKVGPFVIDRFVAISNSLANDISRINAHSRIIVIPPVCDFRAIAAIPKREAPRPFFIYCASAAYEDVAWFVIEAFSAVRGQADLLMVLSGRPSDRVQGAADASPRIEILSNLPYAELIGYYKSALALLIPLRETPQDTARFPQKITEYAASGRPIISCSIGEIPSYFRHGETALLANSYTPEEFGKLMVFALTERDSLERIASCGYLETSKLFDKSAHLDSLRALICQ